MVEVLVAEGEALEVAVWDDEGLTEGEGLEDGVIERLLLVVELGLTVGVEVWLPEGLSDIVKVLV